MSNINIFLIYEIIWGCKRLKNKDKVLKSLKELSKNMDLKVVKGITAEEISSKLNIKRNAVSHLLNELYNDGKVVKINTRPVYFIDKEVYEERSKEIGSKKNDVISNNQNEDDPFAKLIGYNGSLKEQVKLSRSAVSYPPDGLPILLIGNTGVGKSFLAQLIYEYAKSINVIKNDAPFVIFNCAEYANNPELLSANLFGYIKGAFTGANNDKPGLLEEANEGYLFLDEVHRLPPEGQEKLFLFFDKGIFRRLGETGKWRTSKVRFIFATTENPEKSLIKTFLRRIPLIVNIPSLQDRPIHERLQLIYNFYKRESKNLGIDILISKQVLNALLRTKISGNIGKMINVIKYSCAQSYSQVLKYKIKILRIHLYDLPKEIQTDADNMINNNFNYSAMYISQNKKDEYLTRDLEEDKKITDVIDKLFNLFDEYNSEDIDIDKLKNEALICLNQLSDMIIFSNNDKSIDSVAFNVIKNTIENVLNIIENNYGIKYYGNTSIVLSHFTWRLLDSAPQNHKYDATSVKNTIYTLKKIFPKEFIISNKIVDLIEANLDVKLDKVAMIYFTLYIKSINKNDSTNMIYSLIIAHGYSTASSIASVANRLLSHFIFEAFDMPIDMSTQDILLKIESYLKNIDTSKGVIILVDMGSLKEIYKTLVNFVNGDIGIINNITTQLALDVGNRILQGQSLEQIVIESVKENNSSYKVIKSNKNKKNCILTTCITGIGTAVKIRDLLKKCLSNNDLEIIAYDFDKLKGNAIKDEIFREYNVKLIIGTANPEIEEIPYLSLEDLIVGNNDDVLSKILKDITDSKTIEQVNRAIVKLFSLQNVLKYLTILNPDKIVDQVEKVISTLELNLGFKLSNDLKISLYIHISCLIERLIMKDPIMSYSNLNEFEKCHRQFINFVKSSFSVIEDVYKVQIPTSEIGYIYDILNLKIKSLSV